MVSVGVVYVFVYLCQYEEIKEAKEELMKVMELAKPEKPIVLILDSLDQLNPEDGAKQLNWLVIKLPPYVKVIVSTLPEEEYQCLPNLKVLLFNVNIKA